MRMPWLGPYWRAALGGQAEDGVFGGVVGGASRASADAADG